MDHRAVGDRVSEIISSMTGVIESARREASITSDVLARLEGSASRLASAHQSADVYLSRVSEVLGHAHEQFAENIKRTLNVSNTAFYDSLTQATKLLGETIKELEATLGSAPILTSVPSSKR
jgi:hypothetical protein